MSSSTVGGGAGFVQLEDELTPYDYRRASRPLVHGKILVSVEALRGDMSCPICLSILTHTAMTLECSHRFCKQCIEQSLRINSNDCPTCRERVVTRRSLREDRRFNEMIAVIFGKTDDFERREEKLMMQAKARRTFAAPLPGVVAPSAAAVSSSTAASFTSSDSTEPAKKKLKKTIVPQQPTPSQAYVGMSPQEDMLFVLRKHPCERLPPATKKEYIKASQKLTVDHMCKFLLGQYTAHHAQMLNGRSVGFQIVCHDVNGDEHVLSPVDSLEDLVKRFNRGNKVADLVLHYKLIGS